MPRTTEARCHLPASLASLWTTSQATTMLWVLSISDGAGDHVCASSDAMTTRGTQPKAGCLMDSHPAQLEGWEGPGRLPGGAVDTDSRDL